MNPLDDPTQRATYLAQAKIEAQKMADDARARRGAVPMRPKNESVSNIIIGVSGQNGEMQSVDQ